MVVNKAATFQLAWKTKCCLDSKCKLTTLFIPPSHQNPVINVVRAGCALFPHVLLLDLSNLNCFSGHLPMWMMESALAELHCNIHRERKISSNSISGIQRGGSSKLYRLSYIVQMERPNKREGWSKSRANRNRSPPPGRQDPHEKPAEIMTVFFFFFLHSLALFLINEKTSRLQEGALKRRGSPGENPRLDWKDRQLGERDRRYLLLSPLSLRSGV